MGIAKGTIITHILSAVEREEENYLETADTIVAITAVTLYAPTIWVRGWLTTNQQYPNVATIT